MRAMPPFGFCSAFGGVSPQSAHLSGKKRDENTRRTSAERALLERGRTTITTTIKDTYLPYTRYVVFSSADEQYFPHLSVVTVTP